MSFFGSIRRQTKTKESVRVEFNSNMKDECLRFKKDLSHFIYTTSPSAKTKSEEDKAIRKLKEQLEKSIKRIKAIIKRQKSEIGKITPALSEVERVKALQSLESYQACVLGSIQTVIDNLPGLGSQVYTAQLQLQKGSKAKNIGGTLKEIQDWIHGKNAILTDYHLEFYISTLNKDDAAKFREQWKKKDPRAKIQFENFMRDEYYPFTSLFEEPMGSLVGSLKREITIQKTDLITEDAREAMRTTTDPTKFKKRVFEQTRFKLIEGYYAITVEAEPLIGENLAETSMLSNSIERKKMEAYKKLKEHYMTRFDAHSPQGTHQEKVDAVLETFKQYLLEKIAELDPHCVNADRFPARRAYKWSEASTDLGMYKTALRALLDSDTLDWNSLFHEGSTAYYGPHITFRELLAQYWLAASDPNVDYASVEGSLEFSKQNFAIVVAEIRRAHNEGVNLHNTTDNPSCQPGTFGRIVESSVMYNSIVSGIQSPYGSERLEKETLDFIRRKFEELDNTKKSAIARYLSDKAVLLKDEDEIIESDREILKNFIKDLLEGPKGESSMQELINHLKNGENAGEFEFIFRSEGEQSPAKKEKIRTLIKQSLKDVLSMQLQTLTQSDVVAPDPNFLGQILVEGFKSSMIIKLGEKFITELRNLRKVAYDITVDMLSLKQAIAHEQEKAKLIPGYAGIAREEINIRTGKMLEKQNEFNEFYAGLFAKFNGNSDEIFKDILDEGRVEGDVLHAKNRAPVLHPKTRDEILQRKKKEIIMAAVESVLTDTTLARQKVIENLGKAAFEFVWKEPPKIKSPNARDYAKYIIQLGSGTYKGSGDEERTGVLERRKADRDLITDMIDSMGSPDQNPILFENLGSNIGQELVNPKNIWDLVRDDGEDFSNIKELKKVLNQKKINLLRKEHPPVKWSPNPLVWARFIVSLMAEEKYSRQEHLNQFNGFMKHLLSFDYATRNNILKKLGELLETDLVKKSVGAEKIVELRSVFIDYDLHIPSGRSVTEAISADEFFKSTIPEAPLIEAISTTADLPIFVAPAPEEATPVSSKTAEQNRETWINLAKNFFKEDEKGRIIIDEEGMIRLKQFVFLTVCRNLGITETQTRNVDTLNWLCDLYMGQLPNDAQLVNLPFTHLYAHESLYKSSSEKTAAFLASPPLHKLECLAGHLSALLTTLRGVKTLFISGNISLMSHEDALAETLAARDYPIDPSKREPDPYILRVSNLDPGSIVCTALSRGNEAREIFTGNNPSISFNASGHHFECSGMTKKEVAQELATHRAQELATHRAQELATHRAQELEAHRMGGKPVLTKSLLGTVDMDVAVSAEFEEEVAVNYSHYQALAIPTPQKPTAILAQSDPGLYQPFSPQSAAPKTLQAMARALMGLSPQSAAPYSSSPEMKERRESKASEAQMQPLVFDRTLSSSSESKPLQADEALVAKLKEIKSLGTIEHQHMTELNNLFLQLHDKNPNPNRFEKIVEASEEEADYKLPKEMKERWFAPQDTRTRSRTDHPLPPSPPHKKGL